MSDNVGRATRRTTGWPGISPLWHTEKLLMNRAVSAIEVSVIARSGPNNDITSPILKAAQCQKGIVHTRISAMPAELPYSLHREMAYYRDRQFRLPSGTSSNDGEPGLTMKLFAFRRLRGTSASP